MNIINKHPLADLGYHFIDERFQPKGKDEYHLRFQQNGSNIGYNKLSADQINLLIYNQNRADNWNHILVKPGFNAALVKNCTFYGFVRIGKLNPSFHEFHNYKVAEGICNSTVISSDIGDHVCIHNVQYISHYIIGNEVILSNISELACTDKAKFGNGILKEGETDEKKRMVIEVCNENGGRKIIPYDGMLAGDAYMWSKYRDDHTLLDKFKNFTEKKFDQQRGYYGKIGDRTVIKNCLIIKDTLIGSDAYIKGANKLKNLTINSDPERKSQIGEGCELVNGIVGYGCRIFYGVKAVRFITASHSQLKYGARLINSYLGNNSTISCCEVLNSMIFPAHEQHHNNSFLCASLLMGQSNIAAGVTIGSNHNSRGADGEIIAGRGFWPGLCVSLKHNSIFSSFTILAKGDYPSELNIPVPFSLVSNDVSNDRLLVMPGYWFMYNMYALVRNAWKYNDRDKRTQKTQLIEFDYLAPDTINEMVTSLHLFNSLELNEKGEAFVDDWENSGRKTLLIKIPQATAAFMKMIELNAAQQLLQFATNIRCQSFEELKKALPTIGKRSQWTNLGGQLIKKDQVEKMKTAVKSGKLKSWEDIHQFYQKEGDRYQYDRLQHALASWMEVFKLKSRDINAVMLIELLGKMIQTKTWIANEIKKTREKDYLNPFRKMVYENEEEMKNVIGKLEDNSFITDQFASLDEVTKKTKTLMRKLKK